MLAEGLRVSGVRSGGDTFGPVLAWRADPATLTVAAATLVWVVLSGLSLLSVLEYAELIPWLGFDTPILPAVAWLCWRAGRLSALKPRQRRGWRALALAFGFYFCGSGLWDVYEGILGIEPFPSLADAFFLAFYPVAIYGIFCLTERLPGTRERLKFALDCALATAACTGLLWYFLLHRLTLDSEHGILGVAVSGAYPMMDLMLMLAVLSAILKRQTARFALPLTLIAASGLAMMAGDLIFLVSALESTYVSGGLADLAFLASFGLMALAALTQVTAAVEADAAGAADAGPARDYPSHILPYFTVAAVYVVLLWEVRSNLTSQHGSVALTALVTTALVVLRQFVAFRENAELSALNALSAAEARYKSLVRKSSDLVLVVDDRARLGFVTPSVERLLGLSDEGLAGRPLAEIMHPGDVLDARRFCRDLAEDPSLTGPVEWRLRDARGEYVCFEVVGSNLLEDASVRGLVLNARDITDRKRLEDELKQLAFTDPLTLLANRHLFNERLTAALGHADADGHYPSLIFIDLDNFKKINDSLGHEAGDQLLVVAARRLVRATRDEDMVARLGGDEFALMVSGGTSDEQVRALAARLVDVLSAPYDIEGRQLTLSASLGIARAEAGVTAQELMRNADLAMYRAKYGGKRGFRVFKSSMYTDAKQSVDLEMEMAAALERDEFMPFFQPIVDLRSAELVGFEALVRWRHPVRGWVPPGEFIAIAEDSTLIEKLGRTMLEQTCRHVAEWLRWSKPSLLRHVAVNVSGRQIEHTDMVETVRQVLDESGVPPGILVLEITESLLMRNVPVAIDRLTRLKQLGVRIALDDFGTGYSSLSHVHRFPIDILKIDRSFVDGMCNAAGATDGSELVRAIVGLSQALGLEVVAEGIERADQFSELQRLGCAYGQGYYFARPEPAASMCQLLRIGGRLPRRGLVGIDADQRSVASL